MKKHPCLDVTYLAFGADLRGVPQVIDQLVRLVISDDRFDEMVFIATKPVQKLLQDRHGIPQQRFLLVPQLPFLSRFDRFHGLLVDVRYWKVRMTASLIVHPEPRTALWSLKIPQAVLYYDLIFLDPPSQGGEPKLSRRIYFRYKAWKSTFVPHKAAISRYTAQRISREFSHVHVSDVLPLHIGARDTLGAPGKPKRAPDGAARYLYVGSLEPRKNIDALLRSFRDITEAWPGELHLAGKLLPHEEQRMSVLVSANRLEGHVVAHGLLTDGKLRALYEESHFLLFPSLQEGFGLPVVEAMRFGLVVFGFRNSSIPEVGGDAIVLAHNGDFAAWCRELALMRKEPERYAEQSRKSLSQTAEFTEKQMFLRYGEWFSSVLGRRA